MVRTIDFRKKDQLLTSSIHYYYSLTFLRVESKNCTYSNFRLDRKRRRTKIAEWPPPSVNLKIQRHPLVDWCLYFNSWGLLAIQMDHLIHRKSLQKSNKSLDILGYPQEQRSWRSALFTLKKICQSAYCPSNIWKSKIFDTHTPCKNKKIIRLSEIFII